jgi:hypothetical protein
MLGLAVLASLLVSKFFFYWYFISVWCFLAAWCSLLIVLIVRSDRQHDVSTRAGVAA